MRSMEGAINQSARIDEKEDAKSDIVKAERNSPVSIELRNTEVKDEENAKAELEMVVTLCESPHR